MFSDHDSEEEQPQCESVVLPRPWLDLLLKWIPMHPGCWTAFVLMWRSFVELYMRIWTLMRPRWLNVGEERPEHESTESPSSSVTGSVPAPYVSTHDLAQGQAEGESSQPGVHSQDGATSSDSVTHAGGNDEMTVTKTSTSTSTAYDSDAMQEQGKGKAPQDGYSPSGPDRQMDENEELIITSIRATDVTVGFRPLPTGFYTVVHHGGLEWRTDNKPSSTNHDVVEWTEPIPLPSALSDAVRFEVYASSELQPMLGAGEQLRKLTITVEQLLDRSERDIPFTFFPKDGEVSPCSSIFVTVRRRECENGDLSASSVHGPHCSSAEPRGVLEEAANTADEDPRTSSTRLLRLFERFGDLANLEQAISILKDLVRSTSVRDEQYSKMVGNLGVALSRRFERLGELKDLEEAISVQRDALNLTPDGHPHKPGCLNNLGISFETRFSCLGELRDLEEAISVQRDAVNLTPIGDLDKPSRLNNLGVSFKTRFEHFGELTDLEKAISAQRDAVHLAPHGHHAKPGYLSNLGSSFRTRFSCLGGMRDLEEAISVQRDAVNLASHGHSNKPSYLNNLGNSFLTRFLRLGELSDLEEAISAQRDAVNLTPHGHPDKPSRLTNLGSSFGTRFERLGKLTDIENAILVQRDAVHLTPHGNPHKLSYLTNLGVSFRTRFDHLGELRDLEEAISVQRDAVNLTPHYHPHKPRLLSNLGISFRTRFERLGELKDLEEAISVQRDALNLTPEGHPDKSGYLSTLGNSFITRFLRLGELRDLEDTISVQRDAVNLTPHGHPYKPSCLGALGQSLLIRFLHLRKLIDLEEAISVQRDALNFTPHGHPYRPNYLNELGISFRTRFEHLGELRDLEEAISAQRDAVHLTPHGHPGQPGRLNNLGISFRTRFKCLGDLRDLEDAISALRSAVDLTPRGHPEKPTILNNLGDTLFSRCQHHRSLNDLEGAISLYSYAASAPFGPVKVRFQASQKWILCARYFRHRSLLHAYSVAINLLPQLAWIGLSLDHRFSELGQSAGLVWEAAAAALDAGLPETAVEWLERGRSIVWEELFQLRGSYEELVAVHPDYARRLRELSAGLDEASATLEQSLSALSERTQGKANRAPESLQQQSNRHRALAIERDNLLKEIRTLPGFEGFLLRKQFSQLRASAYAGPVVMLNAAGSRCDALIILANLDHVIHIPLPKLTLKRSVGLQDMLEKLLGHARVAQTGERAGRVAATGGVSWGSLLSTLWKEVVKAVLDMLAFSSHEELSRVFWCPSGPFAFLPIHAAGLYDPEFSQPGHKVSDFVISSYVPTFAILSQSLNTAVVPRDNLRLLVVRQPPSDGQSSLPGVLTELNHIKYVIRRSPVRTTLLETSEESVEEVLEMMKEADWVHFACHGIQDGVDSGLCLANKRRLKLRDIIAVSRPRGGLAFLSACQTAMGEEHLSDEAIHIAAGMLYAGFGGVIGTMWSISDELAPKVAMGVYAQLFRDGARLDYRDAARALHEAVRRVRESGEASFTTWVPYIHVGL